MNTCLREASIGNDSILEPAVDDRGQEISSLIFKGLETEQHYVHNVVHVNSRK